MYRVQWFVLFIVPSIHAIMAIIYKMDKGIIIFSLTTGITALTLHTNTEQHQQASIKVVIVNHQKILK